MKKFAPIFLAIFVFSIVLEIFVSYIGATFAGILCAVSGVTSWFCFLACTAHPPVVKTDEEILDDIKF